MPGHVARPRGDGLQNQVRLDHGLSRSGFVAPEQNDRLRSPSILPECFDVDS